MAIYPATRAEPLPWPTAKDPSGVVPYRFDWGPELDAGETIVTATITADPGVNIDSTDFATTPYVDVVFSGGTAGRDYVTACRIVTSLGQTLEVSGVLKVRNR